MRGRYVLILGIVILRRLHVESFLVRTLALLAENLLDLANSLPSIASKDSVTYDALEDPLQFAFSLVLLPVKTDTRRMELIDRFPEGRQIYVLQRASSCDGLDSAMIHQSKPLVRGMCNLLVKVGTQLERIMCSIEGQDDGVRETDGLETKSLRNSNLAAEQNWLICSY